MSKESTFSGRLGYILAAAGSAVGLGNIWRFPYCAAKYGGGIFLLIYVIFAGTFGYSMLISEANLGRMTGCGPIGAYRKVCANESYFFKRLRFGGYLNALVPLVITPYYCVIGGWVTKYVVAMIWNPISIFSKDHTVIVAGKSLRYADAYFMDFISNPCQSSIYLCVFTAIVAVVIILGVEKGIERFNKVLMPLLAVMCVALCIYSCFLPNAKEGLVFYLRPNFQRCSYMTAVQAMGQLFFSLSLAMGISITYGSYMQKKDDLISNVNQVLIFDTIIAFLSGLMIIPALVAFGGSEAAENAGPGLVFCILPQVFASFAGGRICAILFFVLVLFAAATSAVSLLETNVHTICQELKMNRRTSIGVSVVEILLVGWVTALGYSVLKDIHPLAFVELWKEKDILDSLDFVSNSIFMPLAGILNATLVVAVIGLRKYCAELEATSPHWIGKGIYQFSMCLLVVPCLLVVLLNALGVLA